MPTKQVVITGTMTWAEEPGDSGARPEHPIYYPPGIWGPTDPRPGYGLPGPPPGFWGPNDPRPDNSLPGQPPGYWGGGNVPMPTPPIHLGPGGGTGIWGPNDPRPGYGLPGQPPGIWGPNDPRPGYGPVGPQPPFPGGGSPGDSLPTPPDDSNPAYIIKWNPKYGWVLIPIPGAENRPHPDNTLPGDLPPDESEGEGRFGR